MEIILIGAFVVVVVMGTKLYKKRLAHMTPSQPVTTISTGVSGGSPNHHDDGSVLPPKNGENAI